MESRYDLFTLANGLRLVCWHRQGMVSYIGLAVNAGSRDDGPNPGLAHFVEHTVFKGTRSRKGWQISARMENVGGELNAYTSKEETVIYTNAPAGYEERAIELLADIIANSCFPKPDIELEKEVVIEEINSYLDTPSERVWDEFEELAYAESGLAHNILGSPATVRQLKSADCRGFLDNNYTPGNMVVYCSSPLPSSRILKLVEKYFSNFNHNLQRAPRIAPPPVTPFCEIRDHSTHQANTIIGARVFGRTDPRRFPLFLLNNYLGGPNMNSRLSRELREKRGLVYTVESNVGLLSDCGLFLVYFGTEPRSVEKCRKIIYREIDRLAQNLLSEKSFERIKKQYCGQLLISFDHIENRAMSLAKSLLYFDKVHDISTTAERIMEVSREQLREAAEMIAPENCSMLSLT